MPEITGRLDDERQGETSFVTQDVFTPTAGPDLFVGTAADDVADGEGGDDQMFGAGGDDQLSGGADDDQLFGGKGDDQLFGNSGNDRLEGNKGADRLDGGLGDDVVVGGLDDDDLRGGAGADRLLGNRGDDELRGAQGDDVLEGGAGADRLYGGIGNDRLLGGKAADLLEGRDGDDELIGNLGDDILRGEAGADRLDGKLGADSLEGGAGADTFLFTVLDGAVDRITDYDRASDQIDLSALLPDFAAGDRLADFVQLTAEAGGTRIAVDATGGLRGFTDVAVIEGQSLTDLSAEELGLAGGLPVGPVRVDTAADGTPGNGMGLFPGLSADGKVMVFGSLASNLVAGDSNGFWDVFVKDLVTGEIQRVSTTADGSEAGHDSFFNGISADGRIVVLESDAALTGADTNGTRDIYVKDLDSGTTTRASVDAEGNESGFFSGSPTISAAGDKVGFMGSAFHDAEDTNTQIYVKDLTTGELILASASAAGDAGSGFSLNPELAGDGESIAFDSFASNLVTGDLNTSSDVFVKDLDSGAIVRVSVADGGGEANGASIRPAISAEGRFVAFESDASNLVAGDGNGTTDVFVKDLDSGAVTVASSAADGTLGNGLSWGASISADGRHVAFRSTASNLVDGDDNGHADVFVKDLQTGEIVRFETTAESDLVDLDLVLPTLSADGTTVGYANNTSDASDGKLDAAEVLMAQTGFRAGGTLGDDLIVGGAGDESLRGLAGDDILLGLGGADTLTGGAGSDRFTWRGADEGVDRVTDLELGAGGDVLDLSMVLDGVGAGDEGQFVELVADGSDSRLRVDVDGAAGGSDFVDLAVLEGVSPVSIDQLVADGNLVV